MLTLSVRNAHNISLTYAIVWTINNVYSHYTSTPLTISQFSTSYRSRGFHNDLIDAVLSRAESNGKSKFLVESDLVNMNDEPTSMRISRESAIWIIDSMVAYRRLESHLLKPDSVYNRNGFYCIIYTGNERSRMETLKLIFRRLFDIYVVNVNVFLNVRGSTMVYTYYPFGPNKCQSSAPAFYVSFQGIINNSNFTLDKRFFPKKLNNMYGCEMITVTFEHRPYVVIDGEPSNATAQQLHGIEGLMFRLLAKQMNFTIRLVVQASKDRGVVLANGTATGATKMIIEGTANITFACYMYSIGRALVMLPSISYATFPIVLCIPIGKPMTPMQRLTKPFRYIIWSCLGSSIAMGFLLIAMIQLCARRHLRRFIFGSQNRQPCTNMFNTLLSGLVTHPPHRNFARYLLVVWLLYTLVMRSAYTGELYILLQDGRSRTTLRTLPEAVAHKYTFYMHPVLEPLFDNIVPREFIHVLESTDPSIDEVLAALRDDADASIALALLQPTVAEFDRRSAPGSQHVNVLSEALLSAPLTLYMRPHSYLQHRINELLLDMVASGIVRRFRSMYLDDTDEASVRSSYEPLALTVWLLAGIFAIFLVMNLLACLVFLLECWSARLPRLRRFMDAISRLIV